MSLSALRECQGRKGSVESAMADVAFKWTAWWTLTCGRCDLLGAAGASSGASKKPDFLPLITPRTLSTIQYEVTLWNSHGV